MGVPIIRRIQGMSKLVSNKYEDVGWDERCDMVERRDEIARGVGYW